MLTFTNICSPFSQKNIQQCRCGTESCRGVLGPKPKKPVEDRSLASTIIAGTKRKLQDLVGSVRSKSEDQQSPKKRKLYAGNSALTKVQNANMQVEAAREQADRDAAEHFRQLQSRQDRALKRSVPKSGKGSSRLVKSIRTSATVRMFHKAGALPNVRHIARARVGASARITKKAAPKPTKKIQARNAPSTPRKSARDVISESEDDESPNITPASLRSATRKSALNSPAVSGRLSKVASKGNSRIQQRSAKAMAEDPDAIDIDSPPKVRRARSTNSR